jgi:hypothetical protein
MQVRLLTSMAGVGFSHSAGEVIDVDNAYAARMIASGIAETVDQPAAVETATKKTATRKAAK